MNGNNHGAAMAEPDGAALTFQVGTPTSTAIADAALGVQVAEHQPLPDPAPLGIPGTPTWNSDSLRAQVEQINGGLRERLLTKLEHMEPQRLAKCLGEVLARLGYNADGAPKTVDGELEFTGTLMVGGAISSRLAVHVRRQGGSLGVDAVRALRGCLELEEQGLLVTTGDFSDAARTEANAPGRRQISLMNGVQLATLMLDFEIGVEATTLKVYDVKLD